MRDVLGMHDEPIEAAALGEEYVPPDEDDEAAKCAVIAAARKHLDPEVERRFLEGLDTDDPARPRLRSLDPDE